jgi:hypothetical protein
MVIYDFVGIILSAYLNSYFGIWKTLLGLCGHGLEAARLVGWHLDKGCFLLRHACGKL